MRSIALRRRLELETVRCAGSAAVLVFYKGTPPRACELRVEDERVAKAAASEATVRDLAQGNAPLMPAGADYWRLIDIAGNVVLQGGSGGE